ncbi:hypothetical protein BDA99DRAFT_527336, partial [Phascolomyces articulosus]
MVGNLNNSNFLMFISYIDAVINCCFKDITSIIFTSNNRPFKFLPSKPCPVGFLAGSF